MKKRNLHTIALMGLTAGLALSGQAAAEGGHEHRGMGQQIARGGCGASGCGSKSGPKENPMRNGSSFDTSSRSQRSHGNDSGYTAMNDDMNGQSDEDNRSEMKDKGHSCSGHSGCGGL